MTEYTPGSPSFCDLSSPDPEASARFYGELLGWTTGPVSEEGGGYRMFLLDGRAVAGLAPLRAPEQPPRWTGYVTVASVDETAQRVADAGGTALMPPMDVLDAGRMAVFAGPDGAVFCVWQANQHPGAEAFREPGAMCWLELATRDLAASVPFYEHVLGWRAEEYPGGGYTIFHRGDEGVAGAMTMPEQVPPQVPSHWTVYFAVTDADATAARVRELGGQVLYGPDDIPDIGRFASLADGHGAPFAILQPQMPDE